MTKKPPNSLKYSQGFKESKKVSYVVPGTLSDDAFNESGLSDPGRSVLMAG